MSNGMSNAASTAAADQADWTIMLYIAADDTLANFAVESLKQLSKSASASAESGAPKVVVAVHFVYPTDTSKPLLKDATTRGNMTVHEYIFKAGEEHRDGTHVHPLPKLVSISNKPALVTLNNSTSKPEASEKEALKLFVDSVYQRPECGAKRYALILWGHGPELLFQSLENKITGDQNGLYLTPKQLREALDCPLRSPLDIIAFDACSMSMLEVARELKGIARYMVASQDDVPDLSFPYDNLIELFRKLGNGDVPKLLTMGVKAYVDTYKDCICNDNTGMKPVTLSALNINASDPMKNVIGAVRSLACALLTKKDEPGVAELLIQVRGKSRDYAGGLYVDLYDFCANLGARRPNSQDAIGTACLQVTNTLGKGVSSFVLDNSEDTHGHGVSIYFPYLRNEQYREVSKPLVKGGELTHGAKGYGDMLNGAATEYLMCARRKLILDTESYYNDLELSKETRWYEFITQQWTRALMKVVPAELDYHYSAQQSWMNVTRPAMDVAELSCTDTPASPKAQVATPDEQLSPA
jgi:Clostripain family